jgi:hypothetical protein
LQIHLKRVLVAAALALTPAAAIAQPHIQTAQEALAQDGAEYARRYGVPLDEAMRRLRAQQESVVATERLRQSYAGRLAGISIEHSPDYRIVVLLTGSEPVAPQTIFAGGMAVPVLFRTGATATHDQLVAAIQEHQAAIRRLVPNSSGMGVDPRSGELVLQMLTHNAERLGGAEALDRELEALTGVPVRVRVLDQADVNSDIEGGSRLEGVEPVDGRRYACTTGFIVTNGIFTGVTTAAHCPDELTYFDPSGEQIPLSFAGGWGSRHQDVQIHISERAQRPLFYADSRRTALRTLTGARSVTSTRGGEAVCRRGERTGYSCSEVELIAYAPPGDLCGGPCTPTWVAVAGPTCRGGDSGGPVFSGTIAFGIIKGGNYDRTGACKFYYYMSTDHLPEGWALLRG